MTEPKWDVKELRLWVLSSLGYRIPKNIRVKVNKHTDAGNYMLSACEFMSGKLSYRETLEHMYKLAAVIRRAGGFASVHEMDKRGVLSMEIDMGGTIADKNKIAQVGMFTDNDIEPSRTFWDRVMDVPKRGGRK